MTESVSGPQKSASSSPDSNRLLPIRTRADRSSPHLNRLVAHLDGRGWVRRKQLRDELAISDDKLREIARYSDGAVVGSSAHGYALLAQIPVEQANRVIAEMLSRSRELRARAVEITRALHRRERHRMDGAA